MYRTRNVVGLSLSLRLDLYTPPLVLIRLMTEVITDCLLLVKCFPNTVKFKVRSFGLLVYFTRFYPLRPVPWRNHYLCYSISKLPVWQISSNRLSYLSLIGLGTICSDLHYFDRSSGVGRPLLYHYSTFWSRSVHCTMRHGHNKFLCTLTTGLSTLSYLWTSESDPPFLCIMCFHGTGTKLFYLSY